jgi:septation ring formation regulator EzrA
LSPPQELFKKIKDALDISEESHKTNETIDKLCQDYTIQNDPLSKINNYETFLKDLDQVKYTPLLSSQENQQENQYSKVVDSIQNVDSMQNRNLANSANKSGQRKSPSKEFSSPS